MTTPILPDIASVATFGGPMVNLHEVVDPQTDLDADHVTLERVQLAMASYTQPRAWARCTVAGGVVTLADHSAVWGDTVGVAPTPVRTSAGLFTVTWATSYNDLQETPESHALTIRTCNGAVYDSTPACRIIDVAKTAANVVTVRTFDAAAVATDPTEFTVWIW